MKKYVLRSIGWIFDDDWYNNEGEYFTEGVYETREEAEKQLRHLNYLHFLNRNYLILKYEPIITNYKDGSELREKVESFFMDDLHINPTIFLNDYKFPEKKHYPFKPMETQIEYFLKLTGISFYKIAEFEEENISFKVPKKNLKLFKGTPFEEFEDQYFFDEADNIRAFSNEKDGYELGLKETNLGLGYIRNKQLISGSFEELSDAPNLLAGLISISEHLEYEEEVLTIDWKVTAEELMQLDALLKIPILIFEEKPLDELPKVKWNQDYLEKVTRHDWKDIPELPKSEILASIQIHKLKTSDAYLNQCHYELQKKGLTIISDYIKTRVKHPSKLKLHNYRTLSYNDKFFYFYGVILEMKKGKKQLIIQSAFKMDSRETWDKSKIGHGKGMTLKSAFFDSLKNWLKHYSKDFIKNMEN